MFLKFLCITALTAIKVNAEPPVPVYGAPTGNGGFGSSGGQSSPSQYASNGGYSSGSGLGPGASSFDLPRSQSGGGLSNGYPARGTSTFSQNTEVSFGATGLFASASDLGPPPSAGNGAAPRNGFGDSSQGYGGDSAGGSNGYGGSGGDNGNGGAGSGNDDGSSEPAKYEFSYEVHSPEHNVEFGHRETRDGDEAMGSYHVLLPDGRTQIVEYTADQNGYQPKVTYQEAKNGQDGGNNGGNGLGDGANGGGYGSGGPGNGAGGNGGYPSGPSNGNGGSYNGGGQGGYPAGGNFGGQGGHEDSLGYDSNANNKFGGSQLGGAGGYAR